MTRYGKWRPSACQDRPSLPDYVTLRQTYNDLIIDVMAVGVGVKTTAKLQF